MNWVRLLEIVAMSMRRVGREQKVDRGLNWACYCSVCCELRRIAP